MTYDGMTALSAAALGVAATAALSVLRNANAPVARHRLLAVYAVIAGLAALPLVKAYAPGAYPLFLPFMLPLLVSLAPTIAWYVDGLTNDAPWRTGWRIHAAFPLAAGIIALGFWGLSPSQREMMFVHGELPGGSYPAALAITAFVLVVAWPVLSIGYLVRILSRLQHHRQRLRDEFSNLDGRDLRWVEWLMASIALLWIAAVVALLSDNLGSGAWLPSEVVLAGMICLLLFIFASAQTTAPMANPASEPVPETASEPVPEPVMEPVEAKYARSALSDAHAERLVVRIEAAMEKDHLYLDPNLSLHKLAAHVAGAPNLVSQVLNERLGASFFDYVARWRVEAAKPLVAANDLSILAIAMQVGFNSKSTFYKAFKKEVGVTPTAFRTKASTTGDRLALHNTSTTGTDKG